MIFQVIIIIFALLLYIYYKLTINRNYWSDRGVANTGFKFFLGDDGTITKGMSEFGLRIYQTYPNERFVGLWTIFGKPYLMIRNDFELIRSIWIKDFDHFAIGEKAMENLKKIWPSDRNEKLMLNNIQSAQGEEWKNIR